MFEYLYYESLNGGAPVGVAELPSDWHEIKAWAEDVFRPAEMGLSSGI